MFFLKKNYFDVTDENGEWALAYHAHLGVGWIRLTYDELITSRHKIPFRKWSLGTSKRESNAEYSFLNKRAGIVAHWGKSTLLCKPSFFENDVLRWELSQLRGKATIEHGTDILFDGLGYAEMVTLKVPPWKLGITTLSWGRYLSSTSFFVWIVANGARPIRFGIFDFNQHDKNDVDCSTHNTVNDVKINEQTIISEAVKLTLIKPLKTINNGNILCGKSGVFLNLLSLSIFGKQLHLTQHKSTYLCQLRTHCGFSEMGTAIAETVQFGKL